MLCGLFYAFGLTQGQLVALIRAPEKPVGTGVEAGG